MVGQSPYSATKIAADQLALSFYLSFGLPVKIVRPFNTYGPRQSARAIIPTIVIQILNGQKSLNLGNIDTTRDLTFVKDTVNGFIEIAKTDRLFGEIANIGMSEEISIEDLADLISKLMGADVNIETDPKRVRPDKSEVIRLLCDNKKIITNTIWKPEYNLEKGLKETIKWIKNNINYYKSEIYNI
jgi:nucleoside-diphosphate-sugar epimerase